MYCIDACKRPVPGLIPREDAPQLKAPSFKAAGTMDPKVINESGGLIKGESFELHYQVIIRVYGDPYRHSTLVGCPIGCATSFFLA